MFRGLPDTDIEKVPAEELRQTPRAVAIQG